MTIKKTLLTVAIETKAGGSITVADTEETMNGTAVWNAITGGHDVKYFDGEKWQFISADCVCTASATPSEVEVEVEDDNCNYHPCGEQTEPDPEP